MKLLMLSVSLLCLTPVIYSQQNFDLNFILGSRTANSPETIRANKIKKESVFEYRYDKKGNMDSVYLYSLNYDTLGNVVSKETDRNGRSPERDHYRYNEFFQLAEIDHGTRGTDEFDYDSAGNRIMDYWFAMDTSSLIIKKREYNATSRPTALYIKQNLGDFYLSAKYKYDYEGNLIVEDRFNIRGDLVNSFLYEIDRESRETKCFILTLHTKKPIMIYHFDSSGRCLKTVDELAQNFSNMATNYKMHYISEFHYNADGSFYEVVIPYKKKEYIVERHFYDK